MTHTAFSGPRQLPKLRFFLLAVLCVTAFAALFLGLKSELPTPMAVLPVHAVSQSSENFDESDELEKALETLEPNHQGRHGFSSPLFQDEMIVRFNVPAALGFSQLVIHAAHLTHSRCRSLHLPHQDFQILKQVGAHHLTSLNTSSHSGPWLCRFRLIGPGDVSLELHYAERFEMWAESFNQKNFFVQGAMLALALMSLLLSVLMASRMLLALFLWIILTLHFLAMAAGWDHALYVYELFSLSVSSWREINFLSYFALIVVLLQLSMHHTIREASRVVGVFTLLIAVLVVLPVSHGVFLMCYWILLAAASTILFGCLLINCRHGDAENSRYLSLAMLSCLVGGVLQVLSMWISLEYMSHAIGGRAIAIGAAVMLILAVSDALNQTRKQKTGLLKRLELANRELEGVFQLIPQAVFKLDDDYKLVRTNGVFDSINAQCLQDYQKPVLAPELFHGLQSSQGELVFHNRSGASRYFKVRLAELPHGKIGVLQDISAEKTKELAQFYQIIRDEESGAMNRMGLEHLLNSRCNQSASVAQVVRVVLVNKACDFYGGTSPVVSRTSLRSFAAQLKAACKFLGELVHLERGVFCVLINASKEEQALNMLAEPRLWAQIRVQSDASTVFVARVYALTLDLSNGSVDAMHQVESSQSVSPVGVFELGEHRPSSALNLSPVAPAL